MCFVSFAYYVCLVNPDRHVKTYFIHSHYCVTFQCMNVPKFICLFYFWWAFGYFSIWGYCEQLPSHGVCASSTFPDNGKLFPQVVLPIYTFTNGGWEFWLPRIFTSASNILPKCVLWEGAIVSCAFYLLLFTFLISTEVEHLFTYTLARWILISSFVTCQLICSLHL